MEVLTFEGIDCIPFQFPYRPDAREMQRSLASLAEALDADLQEAEAWQRRLATARERAARIDRLSWQQCRACGLENHLWLVSTSDFCADPDRYAAEADRFLARAAARDELPHRIRLGYFGVPPVVPELYDYLESLGGLVIYNETQRHFAMPRGGDSLAEQYGRYSYPYGIFQRVEDLQRECERRSLEGIIHYVQSFCFRRTEDRILRDAVDVPVLTIEADRPGGLTGQLKTRLEAFVQMLVARKRGRRIF
jgi:benzoyl-CoA reductase/2-hydroxyglutaryl-CoA dehydratase subunit BcrC/BadD/HgdB